jgi:hypothetical protein
VGGEGGVVGWSDCRGGGVTPRRFSLCRLSLLWREPLESTHCGHSVPSRAVTSHSPRSAIINLRPGTGCGSPPFQSEVPPIQWDFPMRTNSAE